MRAKLHRFSIPVIAISFALSAPITVQEPGSIRGTVVDEKGAAVEGARVNASLLNGPPMHTLIRYVETDREGHFLIDRLKCGKYGVFTRKDEDVYADTGSSFYGNDVFPTVLLTPSSPSAEIRLQLGPKAGILQGSVTNILNGAPLHTAGFMLTRADSPDNWLSTSVAPVYRVLIPSDTEILLKASAPGFKPWNPGHRLLLHPGAELRLDIALEPSHDPNLHPSRFLVPEGYVGWLLLEYHVSDAQPVPVSGDIKIFKFPADGGLNTSSPGPEGGAEDEYLYYSPNGSLRAIPEDYRNGGGMIWGQYEGDRDGRLSQFGFFVGTEEQYEKFKIRKTHPGTIPKP